MSLIVEILTAVRFSNRQQIINLKTKQMVVKRVELSSSVHSLTGRLIENFFPYLSLLRDNKNTEKYYGRISNGGEHTLVLYPNDFYGEDMDICLNMYIEKMVELKNDPKLMELFKRYISLGIHHLAKPLKIKEQLDNFFK